jgi:hypothetical protein
MSGSFCFFFQKEALAFLLHAIVNVVADSPFGAFRGGFSFRVLDVGWHLCHW